jgi:hypothetical protein
MLVLRKILENLTLFGREDILGRGEMVRNKSDAVPVKDLLGPDLLEGFYGQGGCDVVSQGKINPGIDEFTR